MKKLAYFCVISFALLVFGSVSEVSAVPIGTVSPSKTVTKINQKNKIEVIYNTADVSSVGVLVTDRKLSSSSTPADFIAYFLYDKTGNRLYMQEPLTKRLIGGYPADSPNSIQYRDWRLNCDGTYTKSSGSALDMMWSITAITSRSYNGYIYISYTDRRGSFSGWELAGKMVVDNEPPSGTVVINGNNAATNNVNVTLTLNANDIHTSVAQMHFSNDGRTWTPAEAYRSTKAWTLPAGDGQKTIYARFADTLGNWSGVVSDGIILDTVPPNGTIVINNNNPVTHIPQIVLTLNASDNSSGVSQMQFSNDNVTWSNPEPYSTIKTWTLATGNGERWVIVRFKDCAGNWSANMADSIMVDPSVAFLPIGNMWEIYQGNGTVGIVYDSQISKDVMETVTQDGLGFGIMYPGQGQSVLGISKWVLSFKIKTAEQFRIAANVTADNGQSYFIVYTPENKSRVTKRGDYIYCPIDPELTDGLWHHNVDLCLDGELYTMTGHHVQTVNAIYINGNLRIADIRLRDVTMDPGYDLYDIQDGMTTPHFYVYFYKRGGYGAIIRRINGLSIFDFSGRTYPVQSDRPEVPLRRGVNHVCIVRESPTQQNGQWYNYQYLYGYQTYTINCNPESAGLSYISQKNDWIVTRGEGIVATGPSLRSSGSIPLSIMSSDFNITKKGLAFTVKNKGSFDFTVMLIGTDSQSYYIHYIPGSGTFTVNGNDIYYYLGSTHNNGLSHTVVRDMDEDLFGAVGVNMQEIRRIHITGDADFGAIRLLSRFRVPQEYPEIVDAINAANGGGLIKLSAGLYSPNNFQTKSGIILMGTNGHSFTPNDSSDDTIINGAGASDNYAPLILNPEYPVGQATVGGQVIYGILFQDCNNNMDYIIREGEYSEGLIIVDCDFRNNARTFYISRGSALFDGCAFQNTHFGFTLTGGMSGGGNLILLDCDFIDCTGYIDSNAAGTINLYGCYFSRVNTGVAGSLIRGQETIILCKNCFFLNNGSHQSPSSSFILYLSHCQFGWIPFIENCTFYNNYCAIMSFREGPWGAQRWIIKNNIFANNQGETIKVDYYNDGTPPVLGQDIIISNNNLFGNTTNYAGDLPDLTGQYGNISADPLFTTGPLGNYYLSQTASGQAATSPCVNTGSGLASDLGFGPYYTTRTDGQADTGTVDMGYHYPAQ